MKTVVAGSRMARTLVVSALFLVFVFPALAPPPQPPTITTQPQSQTVLVGANVTFDVSVSGTTPFTYQWRFNTGALGGETNASLTLTNVQLAQTGNYCVAVTNSHGFAISSNAVLFVNSPPVISDIPDQRTFSSAPTRAIAFVIGDLQTASSNLTLTATSGNTNLVPSQNIVFGGSGSNRTVTVTPVGGLKGSATITVTVQDAHGATSSDSFVLTVADFTLINAGLTGVSGGSAAWGDYDNDGDLDILLNGLDANGVAVTKIYRNDGNGVFTDVGASLLGLVGGGAAWGDYNNDGNLDIMLTGNTTSHVMSWRIYRNDGSNVFTVVAAPYDNAFSGADSRFVSLAWADSDNDGHLDALFAGWPASALFHNNRNDSFTDTGLALPGGSYSSVAWADYDNDGDLDLVITEGYPAETRLYRNEGNGVFTVLTNVLPGIYESSVAWGDIDNDGNLDIALTGYDSNVTPTTLIYRNLGNGNFTNTFASLPGTIQGSVAWGDFDNDGNLDLLLCGFGVTKIFRNNGNGVFTDTGISLPGIYDGNAAWGDFDNDGDLDILLVGSDIFGNRIAQVWHNDGAMPNSPPTPPGNLSATPNGRSATFSWSAATDANQSGGLTYNLRVGTTPGGSDVCSPMADASTGYRRIPALGNANARLSWTITNLATGTYYWSVQAVDHAFAGSAFAPERTFVLASPTITTNPQNQSAPLGGTVTFTASITGTEPLAYHWLFNGTNLAGATNASLVLTNVQYIQRGNYSLVVTNVFGAATSSIAVLTVIWPPTITVQPQGLVVWEGTNVTISVVATGAPPLFYQWQFSGTNISGATNSVLTILTVPASAAGNYTVQVTNDFGFTNGATAILQVLPTTPIIVTQPPDQSVPVGINVTLRVGVIGTAPLAYQWRFNNVDLDGATNASLKLTSVQFTNAGVYSARITNSLGSTLSSNATLTVNPLGQGLQSISVPYAVDMVYDGARDIVYITSGNSILRYQVGSNAFLTPFTMGTNLAGLDLSFDGNTLVAADHTYSPSEAWVYVVDLPTGTSRKVSFAPGGLGEAGTLWVAFGNDSAVLTTSDYPGSGWIPLRRYEPATDAVTGIASVFMKSRPTASGDGSVIGIAEGSVSSGIIYKYDVASRIITNSYYTGRYSWIAPGVNRNGTQFAYCADEGTLIFNANLSVLTNIGGPYLAVRPVGVVYHPSQDLVFFAWGGSSHVRAYDTATFNEVARYHFGSGFGTGERTSNRMRISRDGSLLMVRVGGDGINSVGGGINYLRWPTSPPQISAQPSSTTTLLSSNATFSVQAIGTGPFNYQWRFDGMDLDDATNATLALANVQYAQAGSYSVFVYNPYAYVTSSVATLTVNGPPVITNQPQSLTVLAGTNVSFTVAADGTQPFSYQWLFNGATLSTATSLDLANVQAANAGNYSLVLNNGYGSATSAVAVLTVIDTVPIISQQPQSQTVGAGVNVTFTVAATGTEPLSYQWRFEGTNLSGKTSTSLTLTNVQAANAGNYSIVISNSVGPTFSDPATLTVNPAAPTFSIVPANVTATRGAEVGFTARAFGTDPISYQWRFNNVEIPGATNTTLVLTNVQGTNAGGYQAVAANVVGTNVGVIAALAITPPPGFLWARKGGGMASDAGNCVAVDPAGNVYVAGYFAGSATFANSNLTTFGGNDIFVAKYDPAGQLLWLRQAGGTGSDVANAIAVDSAGNVFVTGLFNGIANFGGVSLTNYAAGDLFIAKYDTTGALVWARSYGGSGPDQGNGIAVDAAGNIFVTGYFNSTVNFGVTNLTTYGGGDVFVAKFDGNGGALWAKKAGGTGSDMGQALALDKAGNVVVAGYFQSVTLAFDGLTLTNTLSGYSDIFVVKYDSNGNVLWAKKAGGTSSDQAMAVATDEAGNVFVTGNYGGTPATFDTITLTPVSTTIDIFLAKYDAAGNVVWVKSAGGTSADYGNALAVDVGGNAYVVGRFAGLATFGTTNQIGGGSDDAFVAAYTAAGNVLWVRRAGGSSSDVAQGVAADTQGNVYLTGSFASSPATFGHVTLGTTGSLDFFLAKLATVDPDALPMVTMQPSNQIAQTGANVTFALGFVSAPPVAFQWRFNGTDIPDATNAMFTVSNVLPALAGGYSALISNANGAVTSAVATLTVTVEPDFLWALRAGGAGNDETLAVVADTNGNTYVAGYFSGTADFGGTNLTSAGGEDIFLAKYDSATNLVWVRQAGGSGNDRATCLALDNTGTNVIVAGQFSGTADFSGTSRTSAGGTDAFLARYDANGKRLWVLQAGGATNDAALGVAVTANGQVFITGYYQGSASFGGIALNASGSNDIFVAKYNTAGAIFWAQSAGGSGADQGRAVTCDSAGNAYVAGSFSGTATIGASTLVSGGGLDGFVAKYDNAGNGLWSRKVASTTSTGGAAGGPSVVPFNDEAMGVAADWEGNVFISGYFQGQAVFGTSTNTSASTNQPDVFLAKYDSAGSFRWVQQGGGVLADAGNGLATDIAGNAYVAGYFSGAASFLGNSVTSVGGTDLFAAMYDGTGRLIKVRRGGGAGDDIGQAVAVDGRGNAVAGGYSTTAAAFGGTGLTNAGGRDAFFTKLSFFNPDALPAITTPPIGQTVSLGSNATLTVGFNSSTAFRLQWQLNGANLPGATNSTLSLTNVQYPNLGNYAVVISNSFSAMTSAAAVVTIELSPEFLWLQKMGGTGDDQGRAIAVDGNTNFYVAGTFTGTAAFFNTNFTSTGSTDIFLVKMTSAGTNLWARRAGGNGSDVASGTAVDKSGNVFMAGSFQSSVATFGNLSVTNPNTSTWDAFVAKYDSAGNALWVRRAGGNGTDQATAVAVDDAGNAYVTGSFASAATFGSIGLTNTGNTNFFVAKYDPTGNVLWAKTATGTNTCQGSGITVDSETNVCVTGFLLGSANFGSGTLTNTNSTYYGGSVFLAKYDSAGALKWAVKGIGSAASLGQAIRADRFGNIYATAYKRDYGTNYLLTKYDAAGNRIWTRGASISCCTGDYISADGLALDSVGNPYVSGEVSYSAYLEGVYLYRQGYVAKYLSSDGSLFWMRVLGQGGYGVALDATGNAYLAGRFIGTSYFGTTNTLVSAGGNDAFIVKLGVRPPTVTTNPSSQAVIGGSNVTLRVTVTGTGPFGYQWLFNGGIIPNATNSTLTFLNFQPANAGSYAVVVRNTSGSITSQVAVLIYIPVLGISGSGDALVLSWVGTFILQSATNVAGPYYDEPLGFNPFTNVFDPAEPARYFRLRSPAAALWHAPPTNGGFALSLVGAAGHNYLVLASTNLYNWEPLCFGPSPFVYEDTNAPVLPWRFYRAVLAE